MPIPQHFYTAKTAAIWFPSDTATLSGFALDSRRIAWEQVSPNRKCSLDLFEEGRPLLTGGMIHLIVSEVVAAHGVAWH